MINRLKTQKFNIGILFLLYGVLVSNLFSFATKTDYSFLTKIFMIAGLLLIFHYPSNQGKKQISITFLFILFYQICVCAWSVFSGYSFMNGTGSIIFNIFEIVFTIFLFLNKDWKSSDNFPKLFFYVSGILSIISLAVLTQGFSNLFGEITTIYDSSGEMISDRLALSTSAQYLILSLMVYRASSKKEKVLKYLFFVAALMIIFIVNVRRIIFVSAICFVFLKAKDIKNIKTHIKKKKIAFFIIELMVLISCSFLIYKTNSIVREKFDNLYISASKSIETFIFSNDSKYGQDLSGLIRYNNRQKTIEELHNYNIKELIIGRGYMYRQIDLPYLQAFSDGGLVFGLSYFIISLVWVLKYVFYENKDEFGKLITVFALLTILNNTYTGVPYGLTLTYILLIIFYDSINKRKKELKPSCG